MLTTRGAAVSVLLLKSNPSTATGNIVPTARAIAVVHFIVISVNSFPWTLRPVASHFLVGLGISPKLVLRPACSMTGLRMNKHKVVLGCYIIWSNPFL